MNKLANNKIMNIIKTIITKIKQYYCKSLEKYNNDIFFHCFKRDNLSQKDFDILYKKIKQNEDKKK